jgi:hypothetical protein
MVVPADWAMNYLQLAFPQVLAVTPDNLLLSKQLCHAGATWGVLSSKKQAQAQHKHQNYK